MMGTSFGGLRIISKEAKGYKMKLKEVGQIFYDTKSFAFRPYILFQDNRQHRADGPAIMWDNGTATWFNHGKEFKRNYR